MKRKALLFSLSAAMAALILSSYMNGPYQGGAGNRTGSGGTAANCTGAGCHASNSSNTNVSIAVTTTAGLPINNYVPGNTYKVLIAGANSSALPKFGFQATCVKAGTNTSAGTFTSAPSNVSIRSSSPVIVEHNTPIAGTVGAGGTIYQVTFNWTAPVAGTGPVSFYSTLNAVNGNASVSGDEPNTASSFTLQEQGVGVSTVSLLNVSVYPNPASNMLHIKLEGAANNCSIQIHDISGRIITAQQSGITNGEAIVQVGTLKPGNYYLSALHDGKHYLAPFVKY